MVSAVAVLTLTALLSACAFGKQPEETSGDSTAQAMQDRDEPSAMETTGSAAGSGVPGENASLLSDDLFALQIELNDSLLSLPCGMDDLETLGYRLPESKKDAVIEGGRYSNSPIWNDSRDAMFISLYNTGDSDLTFEQCEVYEITITESAAPAVRLAFAKGITYGFTREQIEAIYGEPGSEYESEDQEEGVYLTLVYRDNGDVIEFDLLNNELIMIHLSKCAV